MRITLSLLALALTGATLNAEVRLQGAGATFPAPLYQRLVAEYQKANPDVKIDYQAIGSGGGVKAITDATVDFGASDAPLGKKDLEKLGAGNVVQIPSCAGAVVPAYNLPGLAQDLRFTGEVLAAIYQGRISKWNDAELKALNPGVALPDLTITPVWRTDGSGTTYVWTSYLCTQSEAFKGSVGMGKEVQWPIGQGGKGNQGVTAVIQTTKGALGYIEQNYANENKIPYGAVRNQAGRFVKASPESIMAAGEAAAKELKGPVLAANLWNQAGEESYPIAALTYLIVYQDLKNLKSKEQAAALADFLWWATHEGQEFAAKLDYAPLAPAMLKKVEEALSTLRYAGQPLPRG